MKIVVITGTYPPNVCGVGDYTRNLLEAGDPSVWTLHCSQDWSLCSLFGHIRRISQLAPDAVVLQYPTQGYGWSLVPHLLGVYFSLQRRITFALALHEYSQLSLKARSMLDLLLAVVNSAVFTTRAEADIACGRHGRLRKRHAVIPINFNIVPAAEINPLSNRSHDLCYFGQVRPNKGLEEFIDAASKLSAQNPTMDISIMGQMPEGYDSYFTGIKARIRGTSIKLRPNLPGEQVTAFLNSCKVVYLPFPDGISERRGSFLAAISNGAAVVSHRGKFSSPALETAFIDGGNDSLAAILATLALDEREYAKAQAAGFTYLRENVPASWKVIAQAYEAFLAAQGRT